MIPKIGYVSTTKVSSLKKIVNGIELPENRKPENDEFIILGFGFCTDSNDVKIGDHVLFELDPSHSVNITIDGKDIIFNQLDKAVAVVGEEDIEESYRNDNFSVCTVKEKVIAVGDKIVIKRSKLSGYYKVGELFIPYEKRELGRAHNGTIIAISDECSKKTGFTVGMQVIYDYNASFGHENDFDIVKEENVFCALTVDEIEKINGAK